MEGQYERFLDAALSEDIGSGDHSTLAVISPSATGKVALKVKESGVLAGMQIAEAVLRRLDPEVRFSPYMTDGQRMKSGDIAFEAEARVHALLQGERVLLNCMQRMSGIATLTSRYVEELKGYHTKILDTRKTTPNFRMLEKEAVRIGGAFNHRMGLYDMIMLKDNHIDFAGGIVEAIEMADAYRKSIGLDVKIEVETRSLKDVIIVCENGKKKVFRIMLDNFTPEQVAEALEIISGDFETEASGGICLENIKAYAATGVDYVSVGALIHHAVSLDLSLKAIH